MLDAYITVQQRNRLVRSAIAALVLLITAGGVVFIELWKGWSASKPDYHRILMEELARQHYLATGTPTIVREDDQTREFFESQYNLKNKRDSLPYEYLEAPVDGMLQFSYVPGSRGVVEAGIGYFMEKYEEQRIRPTITLTEPTEPPVALWVYSKKQGLLACILYELTNREALEDPGLRIFQTVDRKGVVSVQGAFPEGKIVPYHAYLLPWGDLRLENLDRLWGADARRDPDLHRFEYALPFFFSYRIKGTGSTEIDIKAAKARLRAEASPFFFIRWSFRGLILPLSLLWLIVKLWHLSKLRKQYTPVLATQLLAAQRTVSISFFHFMFGNLESYLQEEIAEARARQSLVAAQQKEEAEKRALQDDLQKYREQLELTPDQTDRLATVLSSGSLEELRGLRDFYRPLFEQKIEQLEREQQKIRERQREIQRLESEFEALGPEQRENEAREAWTLYQQAQTMEDARKKLQWLKEARKRIPRELRTDHF